MHEMQAYQASIAHRAATAEQIEQSIERYRRVLIFAFEPLG
jgi:hypothetical protein